MAQLNIKWYRELSEKPRFHSTWGAEVNGVNCIVKKIEAGDSKKLNALAKRLKKQMHFSGRQSQDEKRKVCFFDDMIEGKGFIAFYRKYRPGTSLKGLISGDPVKPTEAVRLCLETAKVLQIAHAKGICHGDLNPRNIIIGEDDAISVVDWDNTVMCDGIQEELIGPDAIREDVGAAPEYMPLEQFRGGRLQPQTDVYALGVILYQMLCGHTPFENFGAKTPLEMGRFKEKNEPESIRVTHPGLAIPDGLDDLIERSLKNDPKQRIPSIDVFIQKLQEVKFESEQTASVTPEPVRSPDTTASVTPEPVRSQDTTASVTVPGPSSPSVTANEKEYKLVLIGPRGAGKTVLTAGLYAMRDGDFSVTEPDGKTSAGAYISRLKKDLKGRKWPSPTDNDTIVHIPCNLNYLDKHKRIAFDDYAGGRLRKDDFNNTLFSKPDGVFILLNPGGPQWRDQSDRRDLIDELKFYIERLSKRPNRPPIALIITASDRLNADLRLFAPVFEECVKELEDKLTRKKCPHRTFRVSISDKLGSQSRPELRPQGISEPFIWMMEHFDAVNWRKRFKRIATAACIAVAALLAAFAGEYCREAHSVSSLKKEYQEIEKSFSEKGSKKKQDYLTHVIRLVELRNRFCSENHFSNATRLDDCSSACRPSFFLSPAFRNDFDRSIATLENLIDSANHSYLSIDLDDALENPTAENRKVMGRIEKWNTLRAENDRKRIELQRKCADELPVAVELYDQRLLEKEFQAIIDNPGMTFPPDLDSIYRNWIGTESKRPKTEWDKAVENMKQLEVRAKCAVENRRAEKRKVDDFLAEIREVTTPVALDRFEAFSLENADNPFFNDAEDAFVEFIEGNVDEMIRNFGDTEHDYRSMYDVAAKIRSLTSRKLGETWMNRFANEFFEMMNVEHTLTVTDIQVCASYDEGAYIENCVYAVGDRTQVVLIDDLTHAQEEEAVFKEELTSLPFFETFSVPCAPWENVKISFDLWKNVRRGLDKRQGTKTMSFIPGSKKNTFVNFESSDIVFRIFFQFNYKKMSDILSEIGKNDVSE